MRDIFLRMELMIVEKVGYLCHKEEMLSLPLMVIGTYNFFSNYLEK